MHAFLYISIHTVDAQTCGPNYIVIKITRKCKLVSLNSVNELQLHVLLPMVILFQNVFEFIYTEMT